MPTAEAPAWKTSYDESELASVACPHCGATRSRTVAREFGIAVARCSACWLTYTRTPLPNSQGHYAGSREGALGKYGGVFTGAEAHPRDSTYEEHLATLERFGPPGALLDVGSHSGFFLRKAKARGWTVTGVEPNDVAASLAREWFGLDVVTGTLHEANLPDASFDAVTFVDVFEHVGNPGEVLAEARRLLRPGGHVFIKVPNVRYVLAKYWLLRPIPGLLEDVLDAREHLVYYSDRTLRRAVESAGFAPVATMVPSPIQAGGALRRAVRASGPYVARRLPGGSRLPLATDLVAIGTAPR
jgi:2-polyprenyl-3-methyl-5-hydroxy-6-metoxy-1,4-benzoquinol methylase